MPEWTGEPYAMSLRLVWVDKEGSNVLKIRIDDLLANMAEGKTYYVLLCADTDTEGFLNLLNSQNGIVAGMVE